MKNTRGEPSAGGQTAPRETSLSLCLFIPCRSLHCGTRCKHSNYVLVAPSGRVFKNSHQNLLKKVSILSAFRLLIFNTFKVKIVL